MDRMRPGRSSSSAGGFRSVHQPPAAGCLERRGRLRRPIAVAARRGAREPGDVSGTQVPRRQGPGMADYPAIGEATTAKRFAGRTGG
jgi:hypothetical protein